MEILKIKISDGGSYIIPPEIMKKYNLKPGDEIEYRLTKDNVVVGTFIRS